MSVGNLIPKISKSLMNTTPLLCSASRTYVSAIIRFINTVINMENLYNLTKPAYVNLYLKSAYKC